jgi:hypothetical protein
VQYPFLLLRDFLFYHRYSIFPFNFLPYLLEPAVPLLPVYYSLSGANYQTYAKQMLAAGWRDN